jgi:hypothetical protein
MPASSFALYTVRTLCYLAACYPRDRHEIRAHPLLRGRAARITFLEIGVTKDLAP